ncbi:MAG: BrnT family toxin [Devosia sp.]|jgi:uncharacterized DUF497 family protein|nr:BrnT family toxin [Devosia sp.]
MDVRARFDWDAGNVAKCMKHGVTVDEIEALFGSGARALPDVMHSDEEERFIATGRTTEGRALFVVFTLRQLGEDRLVRPISARYMHAREVKRYEQTSKTDPSAEDDD